MNTQKKTLESQHGIKERNQNTRNIRYRRKKNFIKKGLKFSQICDCDVIMLIFDKRMNKLNQFYTTDDFKLENAYRMVKEKTKVNHKKFKYT